MKKEFGTNDELRRRLTTAIILALVMGILCLVYGAYLLYTRSNRPERFFYVAIGVSFLLQAWLNSSLVRTVRLVLSPEQLEFYSPGLALVTSWDNLQRIGSMSALLGLAKYDSLVLRAAATQKTAWWFKLFRKHPEREVPMSMFSNWRVSEIGQEIKRYAPHLFSDSVSAEKKAA